MDAAAWSPSAFSLPHVIGEALLAFVVFVVEDAVHHCRAALDGGDDHVAVDGLGDVG
jgi:hypothetical protein